MTISLSEKQQCVVVVGVGASQGIGAAVSRRFAQEGLKVYVVGRTLEKAEQIATEIKNNHGDAVAYCLDAEDPIQVQQLFQSISLSQEQLVAVIHNVGGNVPSIFLQSSLTFFSKMWHSTFLSAL